MESKVNETINTSGLLSDEGFPVGKLINGKYIIEKSLGKGGMGLTYLAFDVGNKKRRVVIKTIFKKFSTGEGKTAFLKEGEALGRINHDGVVKLIENGEDKETGLPFLVMEYIEGIPLAGIMKRGQMDLKKAVEITEKIAFALTAAHKKDVLHRDLKPLNIMIVESEIEGEKVKLIDFGVAKVADSVVGGDTAHLGFKGTLEYASPEQLNGFQTVSGETFSLAALTYEMLTQVRPFQISLEQRENEDSDSFTGRCFNQIKNLQKAGARNPSEYNFQIPQGTEIVILKGLAYELSSRYETPIEFAVALRDSLNIEPADIKIGSDSPVKSKKSKRKAILLAAVLVSLLSAALLGATYWKFFNQNQPTAPDAETRTTAASPDKPETLFSYSFEVQKMKNSLPDGKPFETADNSQISFGDKFNLMVEREKSGSFYIVEQTGDAFTLQFPVGNKNAKKIEGWRVSKSDQTIWLVWSKDEVNLLEQKSLNQDEIRQFFQKNQTPFDVKQNQANMDVKSSENAVIYKLSL